MGLCNMPLPMNPLPPPARPLSGPTLPPARWPTEAFAPVDAWALMRGEPLPAGVRHRAAWRQACADVARDPLQLEAHARRVLLACMAQERLQADGPRQASPGQAPFGVERVHVFDALVDCFLALGSRGRGFRAALLERGRLWLDDERHDFLARHLPDGLSPQDALPTYGTALLDPGLIGLPVLVRQLQPLPFDTQAVVTELAGEPDAAPQAEPASSTET